MSRALNGLKEGGKGERWPEGWRSREFLLTELHYLSEVCFLKERRDEAVEASSEVWEELRAGHSSPKVQGRC